MRVFDKMLAGICFDKFKVKEGHLGRFDFVFAKIMMTLPIGLAGIFIIGKVTEMMSSDGNATLPTGRLVSLMYLLLLLPITNRLTSSSLEINRVIKESNPEMLKKFYKQYVYLLFGSAAAFMLLVVLLK